MLRILWFHEYASENHTTGVSMAQSDFEFRVLSQAAHAANQQKGPSRLSFHPLIISLTYMIFKIILNIQRKTKIVFSKCTLQSV